MLGSMKEVFSSPQAPLSDKWRAEAAGAHELQYSYPQTFPGLPIYSKVRLHCGYVPPAPNFDPHPDLDPQLQ